MSFTFDDSVLGRSRFDFRTGHTIFDSDQRRKPWPLWARIITGASAAVTIGWLTWQVGSYGLLTERKKRLAKVATKSLDIVDQSQLLLALASSPSDGVGGFLTNASIHTCERDPNDPQRMVYFASGGWTHMEHTLVGMPLYTRPSNAAAGERDAWWTALTLGKSTIFNGALAFLVASVLLEQTKPSASSRKSTPSSGASSVTSLTYRGQRIVDIGIGSGVLFGPACQDRKQKLEVVCEIGRIDEGKVEEWHSSHPFQQLELSSRELEEVCEFGTRTVHQEFLRSRGQIPKKADMPHTLFERKLLTPSSSPDKDKWIILVLEDGTQVRLDLVGFFEPGWTDGRFGETTRNRASSESATAESASSSSTFQSILSHLSQRFSSLLSLDLPTSEMPLPLVLTPSLIKRMDLRLHTEVFGARHVIKHLQETVLINNEPANERNTQMRLILGKLLRLWGLSGKYLLHKIDVNGKEPDDIGASSSSAEWNAPPYTPSNQVPKQRQSKSQRARRAKKQAQQQKGATLEEIDPDEDDEEDDEERDYPPAAASPMDNVD